MLVLTRKLGESIYISDEIKITITHLEADHVRIGIAAPREVGVHREEVYLAIKKLNAELAKT